MWVKRVQFKCEQKQHVERSLFSVSHRVGLGFERETRGCKRSEVFGGWVWGVQSCKNRLLRSSWPYGPPLWLESLVTPWLFNLGCVWFGRVERRKKKYKNKILFCVNSLRHVSVRCWVACRLHLVIDDECRLCQTILPSGWVTWDFLTAWHF